VLPLEANHSKQLTRTQTASWYKSPPLPHFDSAIGKFEFVAPSGNTELLWRSFFIFAALWSIVCVTSIVPILTETNMFIVKYLFWAQSYEAAKQAHPVHFPDIDVPNKLTISRPVTQRRLSLLSFYDYVETCSVLSTIGWWSPST